MTDNDFYFWFGVISAAFFCFSWCIERLSNLPRRRRK
jgi:hypothetical protein